MLHPVAFGAARYKVTAAELAPAIQVAGWVEGATFEKRRKSVPANGAATRGRTVSVANLLGVQQTSVESLISDPTTVLAGKPPKQQHITADTAQVPLLSKAIQTALPALNTQSPTVIIQVNMDMSLSVFPDKIVLLAVGDTLRIEKRSLAGDAAILGVSAFTRDAQILSLDLEAKTISARAFGQSELIVAGNGKMTIIKATVGPESSQGLANLEISADLTSFSQGFSTLIGPQQADRASRTLAAAPMTLEESKRKAEQTLENYAKQSKQFARESVDVGYKEVVLQLLDERSVPAKGELFPAGGVTVSLLGTEFSGVTSATGHFSIPNVPIRSRFMIAVSDKRGGYVPMISEFSTNDKGDSQLIPLPILRSFTFENSAAVANVVPHETLGSLCATIYDEAGLALDGISVIPDQSIDGPYFFNRFGFLDRTLQATGPNGRVCMFNISAGPFSMEVTAHNSFSGLIPIGIFRGRHIEEEIVINNKGKIQTRLAAMATVHEQLSRDSEVAGAYRSIDMVELVPLGADDPLRQLDSGLATNHYPLLIHNDRLLALSRTSEFEPTLYSYGVFDGVGVGELVTPLIPRGFVEDMAIFAQVSLNPDLGTVIAEHGEVNGQTQGAIKLKLIDERGEPVGQGWYYGDSPVTKAIFFNVNPGKYIVMAETSDGYWLGVDTAFVYSQTVSYIRTGARTRFR
jgi:hypothetical protein